MCESLTDTRAHAFARSQLEFYNANSCSELASGPMLFSNMRVWDAGYRDVPMASIVWSTTGAKPCGGRVTLLNATAISIQHNS